MAKREVEESATLYFIKFTNGEHLEVEATSAEIDESQRLMEFIREGETLLVCVLDNVLYWKELGIVGGEEEE